MKQRTHAPTHTMTIPETREEGISVHNDLLLTRINMHVGRYKPIKSYGKFTYEYVTTFVSQGSEGQQTTELLPVMCNRDQLLGNTLAGNSFTSWATDPFKLNPYQLPTGSTIVTSAVQPNDAMYLDHMVGHIHFSSLSTVPIQADLFFLTPKFDMDDDPRTVWTNTLTANNMGQSLPSFRALTTAAVPADSGAGRFNVGQSPFSLKEFNKVYRAIGYKKILLNPGDQNSIKVKVNWGTLIRKQVITQRNSQYLKGLTVIPMIIYRGGIVKITDGTTTDCTFGTGEVAMIFDWKYVFKNPPIDRFSINRVSYPIVSGTTHSANTTTATGEYMQNVVDAVVQVLKG